MWAAHHRDRWPDLDAVEESTDAGRLLYAGGFVLADPFETLLRQLSGEYLRAAWGHLSALLTRYQGAPADLSWGFLHPGETRIPGLVRSTPSDWIGWTSGALANASDDGRYAPLIEDLDQDQARPLLRYAATSRAMIWRIAPDDDVLGLRLIEALCTDEVSDWLPQHILENARDATDPWIRMARAILDEDQRQLDSAVAAARGAYSAAGYRIVARGYGAYLQAWSDSVKMHLPLVETR